MSRPRLRLSHLAWVDARLSCRDRRVIDIVSRLRLTTGQQLDRTCFNTLIGHSRSVVRGRVLSRLVAWHVLQVVDRRVGGAAKGSTSSIYALDTIGSALSDDHGSARLRRTPGHLFVLHTLAVAELYADLVEQIQNQPEVTLAVFDAEPAAWAPDGLGGYLKPDGYIQVGNNQLTLHWWIEVDRGTESLPTLEHKLRTYLGFVERGQLGPVGLVPRVLISVITQARLDAVQRLIARLPDPASELFVTHRHHEAAFALLGYLRE